MVVKDIQSDVAWCVTMVHAWQELLTAALSHFQAFGQITASTRALVSLAQLEQLGNQPQAALQLVQQACKAGGDTAACCQAVQLCAELSCQLTRRADAVAALESGISMMDELARSVPVSNSVHCS